MHVSCFLLYSGSSGFNTMFCTKFTLSISFNNNVHSTMLLYIFEEIENFVAKKKCSILKTKKKKINKK